MWSKQAVGAEGDLLQEFPHLPEEGALVAEPSRRERHPCPFHQRTSTLRQRSRSSRRRCASRCSPFFFFACGSRALEGALNDPIIDATGLQIRPLAVEAS